MIIKGGRRKPAAPVKKTEEPAAAPKKERKVRKVEPVVVEPTIIEESVVEKTVREIMEED